jgi:hypothetical protein
MADKYAMFDRYARNLEGFVPAYRGGYGCPLSMSLFMREAIGAGELTEEHCIPKGLGRNITVLTAKHANNEAGAEIDAHLHRMIMHDEVFRDGVGVLSGRFVCGEYNVGVDFTRDMTGSAPHNHFRISGDPRRSADRQVAALQKYAKQAAESNTLNDEMMFRPHPHSFGDRWLARVALLKAGYLLLFRQFGYPYILDGLLNAVRGQISNPRNAIPPLEKTVYEMKAEDYREGTLLVTEPEELMAYIVWLQLQKDPRATPRYFGVILPATPRTFDVWKDTEAQTLSVRVVRGDVDYIEHPRPFLSD